jgi:hypothetical protein
MSRRIVRGHNHRYEIDAQRPRSASIPARFQMVLKPEKAVGTLASRMPKRTCQACQGNKTLAPGGNERHRRVCGQCLGRGFHFTGKEAPRGSWFEGPGELSVSGHHFNNEVTALPGLTTGPSEA